MCFNAQNRYRRWSNLQEDRSFFSNKAIPIHSDEDIAEFLQDVNDKLEAYIENYTSRGSNWIVAAIEKLSIHLVKYRLLKGGAYVKQFKLPKELLSKHCVLNIPSQDNMCLKYAICASLHHYEVDD